MSTEFTERMRNRDPACKELNLSEDQIDAQVAALQNVTPPLMRHEPRESGGITRQQFMDVVNTAAQLPTKPGGWPKD